MGVTIKGKISDVMYIVLPQFGQVDLDERRDCVVLRLFDSLRGQPHLLRLVETQPEHEDGEGEGGEHEDVEQPGPVATAAVAATAAAREAVATAAATLLVLLRNHGRTTHAWNLIKALISKKRKSLPSMHIVDFNHVESPLLFFINDWQLFPTVSLLPVP